MTDTQLIDHLADLLIAFRLDPTPTEAARLHLKWGRLVLELAGRPLMQDHYRELTAAIDNELDHQEQSQGHF